jgi:2-haloacid dehalogenase
MMMCDSRSTDCPTSAPNDQSRAGPADAPDARPPRIDAVVFDLGGVLLDWNPRYLYRQLFEDEAEMERFLAEVCTMSWHAEHDRGLAFAESAARLAAAHPAHADLIWAWGQRSEEMIAGPIEGSVALLDQLRQRGVRLLALTNMERETYPLRRERFAFMRWFEGTVVSSAEGLIKPDPRIFSRLVERYELTPERTLFIDDSSRNVDAARGVGLRAVHFTGPRRLQAILEQHGLL